MNLRLPDPGFREMIPSTAGDVSTNLDTAIAVGSAEIAESNAKSHDSAICKGTGKEGEREQVDKEEEDKCPSCVIDIKTSNDLVGENQKLCRICHLSAKESGKTSLELSDLGCGCKGELGVAHLHCAEAWFRVKGNRLCEICGQTAKNITGVCDNAFMVEWYENRPADTGAGSLDGRRRCLRGQPLCNLLMACLVIAFVLPWFFRVHMF